MAEDQDEIKRRAEIDRLLSKANVHRMRGEYIEAEDACREAAALDDTRADLRELLGDLLYARDQIDAAAEEYKKALEIDKSRASAETKYAKAMLEIGEREYGKQVALEMIENPKKFADPPKHPLLAFFLSAVFPGSGQLYNREFWKGAIIIGVFLLSVLILAAASIETQNLLRTLAVLLYPAGAEGKPPPAGVHVWLAALVLFFMYIYAVIDAPIAAAKFGVARKPEPPSPGEPPALSGTPAKLPTGPKVMPPAEDEQTMDSTKEE